MRRLLPTTAHALAAALLLAATGARAAGDAPLAHLDFLDSPAIVGGGQWQDDPTFALLPAGPHDRPASHFSSHFATLAARADSPRSLALRASSPNDADLLPLETSNDRLRRLRGFSDVSLGARWRVRGGDAGWLPGVAWLADVEATMGSPAFRDRNVRPSLRATAQWALPGRMTLGLMPGVYRDRGDDGRHYAAGLLAVTLGRAWTPRLQGFVELAGQRLSRAQAGVPLLDVDTGVAFTASKCLELDAVVSRNLAGGGAQAVRGGLSVSSRF